MAYDNLSVGAVVVGNSSGAGSFTIHAGTGGISIGNDSVANTISIGSSTTNKTINIGFGAANHTIRLGVGNGTTSVDIESGSGGAILNSVGGAVAVTGSTTATLNGQTGVSVGTVAAAIPVAIGNVTGTTSVTVNTGSGGIIFPSLTGILTANAASKITASTVTQHGVVIGGASNALSTTSVGSTGQVLQGNTGADPTYSTATYPSTTTINQLLYSSSNNVVAGLTTANQGVLTTGTTGIPVITALATNGQVIIGSTAGAPAAATLSAGAGISITNGSNSISIAASGSVALSFATDSGTATPSAGTITFNAVSQAGSSVKFTGSGSTVSLNTTDANSNTIIGVAAGNNTISGANNTGIGKSVFQFLSGGARNTALGYFALNGVTTGTDNIGIGYQAAANGSGSNNLAIGSTTLANLSFSGSFNACVGNSSGTLGTTFDHNSSLGYSCLSSLLTGSYNVALGFNAGSSFTGSESSNILLHNLGTIADNNTIRIGTQGAGSGQQNKCFIAGITGVTVANPAYVTLNTSTGQLGTQSAVGGGLVWTDVTGATQTIAAGNGYLADRGLGVAFTLPASSTIGDVFRIAGVQGSWTLAQAANQQIKFGNKATTVGATGSLASAAANDCIECVATNTSASSVWLVISSIGNITVA